ncbi:hypothetical protein T09_3120 [Trichinella sp. T9]|nr:hypothetical protein T09_3120 [Trichinella sp. T9]
MYASSASVSDKYLKVSKRNINEDTQYFPYTKPYSHADDMHATAESQMSNATYCLFIDVIEEQRNS